VDEIIEVHLNTLFIGRGVYVCGNTTSSAGLTVTVVKDAGGDYTLEAVARKTCSDVAFMIATEQAETTLRILSVS
jgi:hypothetical protein